MKTTYHLLIRVCKRMLPRLLVFAPSQMSANADVLITKSMSLHLMFSIILVICWRLASQLPCDWHGQGPPAGKSNGIRLRLSPSSSLPPQRFHFKSILDFHVDRNDCFACFSSMRRRSNKIFNFQTSRGFVQLTSSCGVQNCHLRHLAIKRHPSFISFHFIFTKQKHICSVVCLIRGSAFNRIINFFTFRLIGI